jgi:hypothetical protein
VGRLREEMGLGLGPRGKEGRPRGEKRGGEMGRAGLGCLLSSLLLFFFCFSNSLIQTILIEFKCDLNSNLYTQHK